jgi:hypothetical protein
MEKIFGVKEEVAEGHEGPVVVPLVVDIVEVQVPFVVVTIEVRRIQIAGLRVAEEPPSSAPHAVHITTD